MVRHHKCAVDGCEKQILGHLLMCPYHWHMVAKTTKAGVIRSHNAYRLGTLDFNVYAGWAEQAKADVAQQMRETA